MLEDVGRQRLATRTTSTSRCQPQSKSITETLANCGRGDGSLLLEVRFTEITQIRLQGELDGGAHFAGDLALLARPCRFAAQ